MDGPALSKEVAYHRQVEAGQPNACFESWCFDSPHDDTATKWFANACAAKPGSKPGDPSKGSLPCGLPYVEQREDLDGQPPVATRTRCVQIERRFYVFSVKVRAWIALTPLTSKGSSIPSRLRLLQRRKEAHRSHKTNQPPKPTERFKTAATTPPPIRHARRRPGRCSSPERTGRPRRLWRPLIRQLAGNPLHIPPSPNSSPRSRSKTAMIAANSSDRYQLRFASGESVQVAVRSDGRTFVRVEAFDCDGCLLATATDQERDAVLTFRANYTGLYQIVVKNAAPVDNQYTIWVN